ncbi:MAG: hypothetical protein ACR2KX_05560 [Chitinophagaceae bacterium]
MKSNEPVLRQTKTKYYGAAYTWKAAKIIDFSIFESYHLPYNI